MGWLTLGGIAPASIGSAGTRAFSGGPLASADLSAAIADALNPLAKLWAAGVVALGAGRITASGLNVSIPIGTIVYAGQAFAVVTSAAVITVPDSLTSWIWLCSDGQMRSTSTPTPPARFDATTAALLCVATAASGTATIDATSTVRAHYAGLSRQIYDGWYSTDVGAGSNVLGDPGFEDATFSPSWATDTGGGATVGLSTSIYHGGAQSAEISGSTAQSAYVYQDLTVTPGTQYELSFWYYLNVISDYQWFWVYDNTHSAYIVPETTLTGANGTWLQASAAVTVPAGCTSIRIALQAELHGLGTSQVYFDDVTLSVGGVQLQRLSGALGAVAVALRTGWLTGLRVDCSNARTAGSATFEVYANGVASGLQAVLDGTNPQAVLAEASPGAIAIAAGDQLDVRVTTSTDWAAGTTPNAAAAIEVMT